MCGAVLGCQVGLLCVSWLCIGVTGLEGCSRKCEMFCMKYDLVIFYRQMERQVI